MKRKPARQLPLFAPGEISQRRNVTPEPAELYFVILALRRQGHRVYRAGSGCSTHLIDGKRVSGKLLVRMAERER
jgi:hypothetical protein